jgi:signal recognition particle GTPase
MRLSTEEPLRVTSGEQPDDLQPFDAKQFAQALFEE